MASGTALLSTGDYVIILVSLVAVFGVGWYSSRKSRKKGESVAPEAFFLAGRSMPWWICAASLFASNIGTEHFVGQAGAAAWGGIAVGMYEWSAAYLLLLLGWVFAPVYLQNKLTTIPEFLEGRFNKQCRFLFVIITMLTYVLAKIGASVYAGSVLFEVVAGFNMWTSAPIIIFSTAIYTAFGGLTAVMLTDTVQTIIFVIGGLIGTGVSLGLVGGMSGLFQILREADGNLTYMTHLGRHVNDKDYPWPGMLVGMPIVSMWYWCIDQEMVQRVFSVRGLSDAKIGTATAGFIKVIPVFITVVPGMVARALYEQCIALHKFPEWCGDPSDDLSNENNADKAYPLLVVREFPFGVKGIMVASFLAAMMSSLSSVYNSASTIFTYDVYQRFYYPEGGAPPERLVLVGRVTTFLLTVVTFLWLPVIETSAHGVYLMAQSALTHMTPPMVAMFVLGLFWRRANGPGAFVGFASMSAFAILRWAMGLLADDVCNANIEDGPWGKTQKLPGSTWFLCLNFNYFSIILFFLTVLIIVTASLLTPPPRVSQTQGRMFWDCRGAKPSGRSQSGSGNQAAQHHVHYGRLTEAAGSEDAPGIGTNPAEHRLEGLGAENVGLGDPQEQEVKAAKEPLWINQHGSMVANVLAMGVLVCITSLFIAFR